MYVAVVAPVLATIFCDTTDYSTDSAWYVVQYR